jgi:hypothetical protein
MTSLHTLLVHYCERHARILTGRGYLFARTRTPALRCALYLHCISLRCPPAVLAAGGGQQSARSHCVIPTPQDKWGRHRQRSSVAWGAGQPGAAQRAAGRQGAREGGAQLMS